MDIKIDLLNEHAEDVFKNAMIEYIIKTMTEHDTKIAQLDKLDDHVEVNMLRYNAETAFELVSQLNVAKEL